MRSLSRLRGLSTKQDGPRLFLQPEKLLLLPLLSRWMLIIKQYAVMHDQYACCVPSRMYRLALISLQRPVLSRWQEGTQPWLHLQAPTVQGRLWIESDSRPASSSAVLRSEPLSKELYQIQELNPKRPAGRGKSEQKQIESGHTERVCRFFNPKQQAFVTRCGRALRTLVCSRHSRSSCTGDASQRGWWGCDRSLSERRAPPPSSICATAGGSAGPRLWRGRRTPESSNSGHRVGASSIAGQENEKPVVVDEADMNARFRDRDLQGWLHCSRVCLCSCLQRCCSYHRGCCGW
jgi:hypothetical protein